MTTLFRLLEVMQQDKIYYLTALFILKTDYWQ